MANSLLAKNGIIVTGSIEVQNAITASAFSGDGSALTGISTDPFPYTGSAEISGSLTVRDADTTLRGGLNVKGEGTDTSIVKLGGNVNSGGSIRLDFKHHTTENNAGAISAELRQNVIRFNNMLVKIPQATKRVWDLSENRWGYKYDKAMS